jgi:argininosuccinate lyase
MSEKPWGGRFSEKTDRRVETFTSSINIDKRLYSYDIEGSIAHCKMLAAGSIITEEDASLIIQGLSKIKRAIERENFQFDDGLEDIHMHIESSLFQIIGKTAQKLHTSRSRNDQVAVDVRMYLRDEVKKIIKGLINLKKAVVLFARNNIDTIFPGYTHMQRAQPVLFSHHIMAYYEMFLRDTQRFEECLKRINVMPLGSGALAGTTFPIDRDYTAELLGFEEVSRNSIDSVSDRDFIIEFLSAASICMMHFSRMSEELILWSTFEFGFIELPDSFATGSSIMPQKKNPDVPELIRGRTGRVFGNLMALLSVMKSLPLAYNRDMQEDKEPLFDTVDILSACIDICSSMILKLKINKQTMQEAANKGFLNATDLADYLVTKGMPFRQAHACAGKAVSYALDNDKELHELKINELESFSPLIKEDVFDVLSLDKIINRRQSFGGTAKKNVIAALDKAEEMLDELEKRNG